VNQIDFSMSRGIEPELLPELGGDERLLWSGRPRQGVRFQASDILMIPFSLMWGGFAIFWEASVLTRPSPLLLKLWGIPFVLMGLYITVGRFFHDSYRRAHTLYGVTGQRAIIISGVRSREVRSIDFRRLDLMSLDERADKSGTLTFGPANPMRSGRHPRQPAFEMIEKVREVYDLIRENQAAAR
jgi:hypothetical protein